MNFEYAEYLIATLIFINYAFFRRSKKYWFVPYLIVLPIFVFVLIQGYLPWNVEEGNRREIKIVQAYQSIKHPEGAELLNYELNRKIITRWLFSKYIYPIDNDAVKKYYDQEFVSKGWKQISYNSKPDPEHIFGAYIKDNLKLVLGLHNGNIWTISIHYIAEENY